MSAKVFYTFNHEYDCQHKDNHTNNRRNKIYYHNAKIHIFFEFISQKYLQQQKHP